MIPRDTLSNLPDRFPLSCQWELTCRCNLRCVMCYTDCFNHPEHIRRELRTEEIIRILDELAEAGCLELCLTGGEPLARTDFFTIYDHAVGRGFLITLFTNGTLITEPIADRLAQTPPYRIEISLHGRRADRFEQITQGPGSFDRCLAAVGLLLARNIRLVLKTTAMTVNQGEILEIKRFIQALGPVGYKLGEELRPALDGSAEPLRFQLPAADLVALNRQDPALWTETSRRQAAETGPCRSGLRSCHIDAYGFLQRCSGNRRQGFDLRQGSFKEGFYKHVPDMPCAFQASPPPLLIPTVSHA